MGVRATKKERRGRVAQRSPRGHEELAGRAHLRVVGLWVAPERLTYLRTRLATRLSNFAHAIQRLSVSLGDVNAWRGGVDKVCRIEVVRSVPRCRRSRWSAPLGVRRTTLILPSADTGSPRSWRTACLAEAPRAKAVRVPPEEPTSLIFN